MATIKAKVGTNQSQIVAKKISIGQFNIAMSDITDVDTSGQTDGSMMIFNDSTGKYEMSTQLDNENLSFSGGTY
jgi:hypothetical protein|tara:strand:+ start:802 stop:1023 length:222 start_codon:yes stop_codon:yes gene_type:complete